jgi:hypothetical protein
MGAWANLVDWLFPAKKAQTANFDYSRLLTLFNDSFESNERVELNSTFVSAVTAHADFFSQIVPTCYFNDMPDKTRSGLNYILKIQPNPTLTAPAFYKNICTNLYYRNYSLTWIERSHDQRTPAALWPIDPDSSSLRIGKGPDGRLWFEFQLNGQTHYYPIDDMIVLQRQADPGKILSGRSRAIDQMIRVIDTSYTGLDKSVKQSIILRFIIQGATVYNDQDREKIEKQMNEILGGENAAAYIGAGDKVTEVASSGKWPLAPEIQTVESKVHEFLGISPEIIKGKFTEDDWNSYFARSVQPPLKALAVEMTAKLFTKDEYFKGNEIRIVTDGMSVMSNDTALKRVELKLKFPVVVPNDLRKDMGEDPIEGGDKAQVNLNWVGASKQDQYQGVGAPNGEDPNADPSQSETKPAEGQGDGK